jgi:hypothetical protein
MPSQIPNFNSDVVDAAAAAEIYLALRGPHFSRTNTVPGLSGHVRQLHRANREISRWLLFAVLGGAVVAFAIVRLAIL